MRYDTTLFVETVRSTGLRCAVRILVDHGWGSLVKGDRPAEYHHQEYVCGKRAAARATAAVDRCAASY